MCLVGYFPSTATSGNLSSGRWCFFSSSSTLQETANSMSFLHPSVIESSRCEWGYFYHGNWPLKLWHDDCPLDLDLLPDVFHWINLVILGSPERCRVFRISRSGWQGYTPSYTMILLTSQPWIAGMSSDHCECHWVGFWENLCWKSVFFATNYRAFQRKFSH